jgi:hypothetical protein
MVNLHGTNPKPLMSALGQKRTLRLVRLMSVLPPKADIAECGRHVRFVPIAEVAVIRSVVVQSDAPRSPKGLDQLALPVHASVYSGFLVFGRPDYVNACENQYRPEIRDLLTRV